ncbi:hypothetical protein AB0G49_13945 [Streptomyces longwoodensis]|uniref:hypothetical protein n=1 Tax=Streptomyces longwoodensis TaxID=68231 RepID=UPI0033FF9A41
MTTRRKPAADPADTAAADPAQDKAVPESTEAAVAAAEDKAVLADTETKVPEVAPLEPPNPPAPPAAPTIPVGPEGLVPAQLGDRIVDEATGEAPADPDEVFEQLPPYGYICRSRVRLVEHVGMGAYKTPTTRLLVPAGADLRREDAERIVARLHAQLGK